MMTAKLTVPFGTFVRCKGGEAMVPWQVYLVAIGPPSLKAGVAILRVGGAAVSPVNGCWAAAVLTAR